MGVVPGKRASGTVSNDSETAEARAGEPGRLKRGTQSGDAISARATTSIPSRAPDARFDESELHPIPPNLANTDVPEDEEETRLAIEVLSFDCAVGSRTAKHGQRVCGPDLAMLAVLLDDKVDRRSCGLICLCAFCCHERTAANEVREVLYADRPNTAF